MATKNKITQVELIQSILDSNVTSSSIEVYELTGVKMTFVRYVKFGVNCCIAFKNNSTKKAFHYRFVNGLEAMENYISKEKERLQRQSEDIIRYKAECDKQNELIQVGSILYSSWGVEQTNIEFYLVLERKGNFIKIVEIAQDRILDGFMCGTCTPNKDEIIGKVIRKKITNGSISFSSFQSAWLYDGKPKYWSSYA